MPLSIILGLFCLTLAFSATGVYGQDEFRRAGPLQMTAEGQPIDSSQSPQSLLSYLDYQTRIRVHIIPTTLGQQVGGVQFYYPGKVVFPPQLAGMLIPVIEKFGGENMMKAYKLKATSDDPAVADYEEKIIAQAIVASGTVVPPDFWVPAIDLAATLDKASREGTGERQYPSNTILILETKELAGKPEVDDFVMQKVDSIQEPNYLYLQLWAYLLASHDPKLQARGLDITKQLLDTTSGKNAEDVQEMVDKQIIESLADPQSPCMLMFPEWATSRVAYYQDHPPNPKVFNRNSLANIVTRLCDYLVFRPKALANLPVRDGLRIFIAPLATDPNYPSTYDYLAASIGDKTAFQELVKITDRASEMTNPESYTLNGMTETQGGQARSYAEDLVTNIDYQGTGDKKSGILAHLDLCTYNADKGQWIITDPQSQPPAPEPAAVASVVPPASATPSAPAPTPVPVTTAPASVPPVPVPPPTPPAPLTAPPAPVTAVVVTATNIQSRTPNGGWASIPLSVGTKLTVESVEADGTVKAKTDFNFEGTVPKAALHIN